MSGSGVAMAAKHGRSVLGGSSPFGVAPRDVGLCRQRSQQHTRRKPSFGTPGSGRRAEEQCHQSNAQVCPGHYFRDTLERLIDDTALLVHAGVSGPSASVSVSDEYGSFGPTSLPVAVSAGVVEFSERFMWYG